MDRIETQATESPTSASTAKNLEAGTETAAIDLSLMSAETLWKRIQARFSDRAKDVFIHALPGGEAWFLSRREDRIGDFIHLSWQQLREKRGFGVRKISRLVEILAAALPESASSQGADILRSLEGGARDATHRLEKLGVTPDYPIALARFPVRVHHFTADLPLRTIGELLGMMAERGRRGMLNIRELGVISVDAVHRFYMAVLVGDRAAMARVVPMREGVSGLFLPEAIALCMRTAKVRRQFVCRRRLINGQTLDSIAGELDLSRQRVHQMERCYFQEVRAVLDYFHDDRDRMFQALAGNHSIAEEFTALPDPEERVLAERAVERVFRQVIMERMSSPRDRKPEALAAV